MDVFQLLGGFLTRGLEGKKGDANTLDGTVSFFLKQIMSTF